MTGGWIPAQHPSDPSGQPRCQVSHTLEGGDCDERGKVRMDGLLLCERHARRLEARDRVALLQGIISCLDLCLSNITLRRDTNLVRLVRAERAGATTELALAYQELRRAAV